MRADSDLDRKLLGLGVGLLVNQLNKSQQRQGQQTQGTSRGTSQGAQRSGAGGSRSTGSSGQNRPDPARVAAMELQRNLNALGYDAGPVDGVPGAKTTAAVKAFQVSRGYAATGTLSDMQRVVLNTDVQRQSGSGSGGAQAEVLEAQSYLAELGYNPGTPDGAWGPRSQAALEAFRRDMGLSSAAGNLAVEDRNALYHRVHGVAQAGRPGGTGGLWQGNSGIAGGFAGAVGGGVPAASGPSFDCAKAQSPAELAICGNPRLADLDRQIAAAWSVKKATSAAGTAPVAEQRTWLASRNACGGDAACIETAMAQRVVQLTGDRPTPFAGSGGGALGFTASAAPGAAIAGGAATGYAGGALDGVSGGGLGATGFLASAGPEQGGGVAADVPRVHVENGDFIKMPEGFARRLALRNIKHDSGLLQNQSTLRQFYELEQIRQSGLPRHQVSAAFQAMNTLDQEDALAEARVALIAEAQALPEVTPEAPLPLAFYFTPSLGNYEEGRGLPITLHNRQGLYARTRDYPLAELVVNAPLSEIAYLPMGREEAKTFIDDMRARQTAGQRLTVVVWGEITRFGTDETIADFAAGNLRQTIPTTFKAQRATLHYRAAAQGRAPVLITPQDAVVHSWPLQGGSEVALREGGVAALALARELGLPIQDGHVVVDGTRYNGRRDTVEGWAKFNLLSLIGDDESYAEEGERFAEIAAVLLPEQAQRAFFGDAQRYSRSSLSYTLLHSDASGSGNLAQQVFGNPFVRQDAKTAFFATYYDGIKARAPKWPLPVLHRVQVRLQEYDFETKSFAIPQGYLPDGATRRVAALPSGVDSRTRFSLRSADRIGKLPQRLYMPPDQARRLTEMIAPQNNQIYLAWWADFDWSEDASILEARLGGNNDGIWNRPGRAQLTRIGFFVDAGLTMPILELEPEQVLVALPEPLADPASLAEPGAVTDLAALARIPRSSMVEHLGAVAQAMGGSEQDYARIAETSRAVQTANEFEAPVALQDAIEALRSAHPEGGSLWFDGQARLGEYNLASETFVFAEGRNVYSFGPPQDRNWPGIPIRLVGPNPFAQVKIAKPAARAIVEGQSARQVGFLMRIDPQGVVRNNRSGGLGVELVARPEHIYFYRFNAAQEPAELVASVSFAEQNDAQDDRLARRFEAAQFEGLAQSTPVLDPHVLDLLAWRAAEEVPSAAALASMLRESWQHEQKAEVVPGPRFFAKGAPQPDGATAATLMPSFQSYMVAKSAALGKRFSLLLDKRPDSSQCGQGAEVASYYGDASGALKVLPNMQEYASELRRKSREVRGAFKLEQRYGTVQRRSGPQDGRCEPWNGVVVLGNAVHEGLAGEGMAAARIDFTVDQVRSFAGPNAVPDVVVNGTALETRLVSEGGGVGEPVTPSAQPVEVASTRSFRDVQQSAPARPQVPPPPSVMPEGGLIPDPEVEWPDLKDVEIAQSDIDILGLHVGQSLEEAEKIILARGGVLAAWERGAPKTSAVISPALAYRRLYITQDGTEALTLGSYAPDGKVLAIMRRVVLAEGRLPFERIEEGLTKKYGAADLDKRSNGRRGVMAWLDEEVNPDEKPEQAMCIEIPYAPVSLRGWRRLDGIGAADWKLPGGQRTPWQFGLPDYPAEMLGFTSTCNAVLSYIEERAAQWGASGFGLLLVDFAALQAVQAGLAGAADVADMEIEF